MARVLAEQRSAYELANDLTTMYDSMRMCGMEVARWSSKIECPFDDELAFKIYSETNTAHCFACVKSYTPTSLLAEHRGILIKEAAEILIDIAVREGRYVPPTPEARWEHLTTAPLEIDRASEAEALKIYCARVDGDWKNKQFDLLIAATFTRCLAPLDKVTAIDELQQWRTIARSAMLRALTDRKESNA